MIRLSTRLTSDRLEADSLMRDFCADFNSAGAVVSFCGRVRPRSKAGDLDHLFLQAYPGMSEKSLEVIAMTTANQFDLLALGIWHRIGEISPEEAIVLVCAISNHRRDAFDAVDQAMDRLKSELVLWQKEVGVGFSTWVEPTLTDSQALQRWPK